MLTQQKFCCAFSVALALFEINLLCVSANIIGGDVGDMPDPCAADESQQQLMDKLFERCVPLDRTQSKVDCEWMTSCVANVVAELSVCEPGADSISCNRATVAFVLVETIRRLLSSANREADKHKCDSSEKLQFMSKVCENVHVHPDAEGYGDTGVDSLVRSVSVSLGQLEYMASEMEHLKQRRLFQGTIAIILSFALPGIMAIFSQTHVRVVTSLQCMSLFLIFFYVFQQHGMFYACAVVLCCFAVLVLQTVLLAFVAKHTVIHQDTHDVRLNNKRVS